ncbi:MAG: (deoxy)nucleoside triphosphate pyrophosphohydrolase [Veillonella caviae]|nr:(deoxy)nucleoside triphosphate pyrophosphohydrolase [Veillonella caviae]
MKQIEVVAAIIQRGETYLATQRGYGEFKDGWEFPGGKIEPKEDKKTALHREIREELAVEINVNDFLCTVEYQYETFYLTMHCYICNLINDENITLLEHEAAKWLTKDTLDSVDWLPADIAVVKALKEYILKNN